MMHLLRSIVFMLLTLIIVASCNTGKLYDKNKPIENYSWQISDQKKFDVNVQDSLSLYRFFVSVRHTGDYKYNNLYLFLNTIYPNNTIARDTIELVLTDNEGNWVGEGLSNLKFVQRSVKKGIRFQQKGVYSFIIEHGMRDNPLDGVANIGICIEKQ